MNKYLVSVMGLSGLLWLGAAPDVVLAHDGHDHGARQESGYSRPGEEEETGRYTPAREDARRKKDAYDEEDEDDSYRSPTRRYAPPEQDIPARRERRGQAR